MASIFTRPRPQVVAAGAELIFETLYESDVAARHRRESGGVDTSSGGGTAERTR